MIIYDSTRDEFIVADQFSMESDQQKIDLLGGKTMEVLSKFSNEIECNLVASSGLFNVRFCDSGNIFNRFFDLLALNDAIDLFPLSSIVNKGYISYSTYTRFIYNPKDFIEEELLKSDSSHWIMQKDLGNDFFEIIESKAVKGYKIKVETGYYNTISTVSEKNLLEIGMGRNKKELEKEIIEKMTGIRKNKSAIEAELKRFNSEYPQIIKKGIAAYEKDHGGTFTFFDRERKALEGYYNNYGKCFFISWTHDKNFHDKEKRVIIKNNSRFEILPFNPKTEKHIIDGNTQAINNILNSFNRIGNINSPTKYQYAFFLKDNNMSLFTEKNGKTQHIHLKNLMFSFFNALLQIESRNFLAHSYVVGRSGSGKSEFLRTLLLQLNYEARSCILLDPHGDLADTFKASECDGGYIGWCSYRTFKKSYRIAPHEKKFVVNPFDIDDKSPENRELVAEEITQLILEMVADSNLSNLMKTISFPIIYTLLKLPYSDFVMFADCIRPNTGQEKLEALEGLVESHHRAIWADLCGDAYDTTKRSVFNRLQNFLNKKIIMDTITGKDDFGQIIKKTEAGENLIISLPIPKIGEESSKVLGRFFMSRMQIWAKRRQAIPDEKRYPVFLMVDEAQNFISTETARTLDQFGRKFGLFMILAHQHIRQIEDTQLKGAILANCKNKFVGMSDKATRQALAGEMGISADDMESLKAGFFMAKLGNEKTLKVYARRVKDNKEEKREKEIIYAETLNNGEHCNGWELAGFTEKGGFRLEGGEKTDKIKPKYDL